MSVNLKSFYDLIKSAKVLDGDLILQDGQKLKKVNYGGSFAYGKGWGDRQVTATADQSKSARLAFMRAIESCLEGKLSSELKQTIKDMLGINDNGEATVDKPLSRRLVRLVFDTLDAEAALTDFKAQKGVGEMKRVGARAFGGKYGMMVNQTQFNGIFDQLGQRMDSLTGLDTPTKKAAFLELAAECKRLFVEGRTEGVLKNILSDGLDIGSIAKRMVDIVNGKEHALPVPTCGIAGKPAGGVLSVDTAKLMDDFRLRVEKSGMDVIDEKIKFDPNLGSQPEVNNSIAAEILCNRDPMELARGGIANGERIGRILMARPDDFLNLLKDVAGGRLAQNETYKALDEVNKSVAATLEKTLRAVIAAGFPDSESIASLSMGEFKLTCFAQAQNIFMAIAKGGLENAISAAFSDNGKTGDNPIRKTIGDGLMKALGFMNEEGVMAKDCDLVNKDGETDLNRVFVRKVLVEMLQGASPDRLRQLYAAGLRESGAFNAVETLFEAGPYVQKLIQGFPDDNLGEDVKKVLERVRGKLPSIDGNIVKAQLLRYLESIGASVNDVKNINISRSAGAASVGETFMGTINFNDGTSKEVIIKMLRPDVEWKFVQDAQAVGKRLDAEEGAAKKKNDVEAVNHVKMLRNVMLSTEASVRKEFNFDDEQLNALRSLANTLDGNTAVKYVVGRDGNRHEVSDTAHLVESMGLILKPGTDKNAFIEALKEAKSDEALKTISSEWLMPSQKSCMICEKVVGNTVDKEIGNVTVPTFDLDEAKNGDYAKETLNGNEGLRKLFSIKRELLALTKRSVEGLFYGNIPYLHGDLHASNLIRKPPQVEGGLSSLVMIDHGKAVVLDGDQRELYKELLFAANKSTQTNNGVALARAFRNIVADEVERLGNAKDVDPRVLDSLKETLGKLNDVECFSSFCHECTMIGDNNAFAVLESVRKLAVRNGMMIPQKLYDFLGTLGKLQNAIGSVEEKIAGFRLLAVKQKALEIYETKTSGINKTGVLEGRAKLEDGIKAAKDEDKVCAVLFEALKGVVGQPEKTIANELFDSVLGNHRMNAKRMKGVDGLGTGGEVRLWQNEESKDIPSGSTQDILDVVLGDGVRLAGSGQNHDNADAGRIQDVDACKGDVDKLHRLYYKLPVEKDVSTTWNGYSKDRQDAETKVLEAALQVFFRETVSSLVFSSYDKDDQDNFNSLNANQTIRKLKNLGVNNGKNEFDEECNAIAVKALNEWKQNPNGFDLKELLEPDGLGVESGDALMAIVGRVIDLHED